MQTQPSKIWLRVSVADQSLEVFDGNGALLRRFPVSTSRFGLGMESGSLKTPLGRMRVAEKIGAGEDLGAVFRGRAPTGENGLGDSSADLVLTRILWLEGLDPENANTKERYIYIHGTNHEETIGQPDSHGCVRMRNVDVMDLYDLVPAGAEVRIE